MQLICVVRRAHEDVPTPLPLPVRRHIGVQLNHEFTVISAHFDFIDEVAELLIIRPLPIYRLKMRRHHSPNARLLPVLHQGRGAVTVVPPNFRSSHHLLPFRARTFRTHHQVYTRSESITIPEIICAAISFHRDRLGHRDKNTSHTLARTGPKHHVYLGRLTDSSTKTRCFPTSPIRHKPFPALRATQTPDDFAWRHWSCKFRASVAAGVSNICGAPRVFVGAFVLVRGGFRCGRGSSAFRG